MPQVLIVLSLFDDSSASPAAYSYAGSCSADRPHPALPPRLTHLPARLMAIVGAPTSSASVQNRAAIHHRKVKYIM